MESRAKFLGHSIHQQLIVFPVGLLATAVAFDIVHLLTGALVFSLVAYWMIIAGLVGGLVAAPFGLIDWLRAIPSGTRAKRVGAWHGAGNVLVMLLFLASVLLRAGAPEPGVAAYLCSFAGAGVALWTAWLGGELVSRLGVGVYNEAHADAPSSLMGSPLAGRPRQPESGAMSNRPRPGGTARNHSRARGGRRR